ncbi:MAG TPA: hypothetical protein P5550_10830 [Bacteroidales bacterium]|nr:hypothetical protein [Bacteroidales bacterium]HRZ76352.1 hypothetical protein [Bacteroidales bacterium]
MGKLSSFCLSLLLMLVGNAFTQSSKPVIQKGPLMEEGYKNRIFVHKPLGSINGRYYFIATSEPNQYMHDIVGFNGGDLLGRLDPNMKTTLKPIRVDTDLEDLTMAFSLMLRDRIYLFVAEENPGQREYSLYAQEFDPASLSPDGGLERVAEIGHPAMVRVKRTSFQYRLSPDSSKMLVFARLSDKDGELAGFAYTVLDPSFKVLATGESAAGDLPSGAFRIEDYGVNNAGEVFILGSAYTREKEMKKPAYVQSLNYDGARVITEPVYDYYLISYAEGSKRTRQNRLSMENAFIRDLVMAFRGDTALLAGTYSAPDKSSVIGSCLLMFDSRTASLLKEVQYPFPEDLILFEWDDKEKKSYYSSKKDGDEFEDYTYDMHPLLMDRNGGFWLIAQQVKYGTKSVRTGNMVEILPEYTKDDAYVVRFNPEGEVRWARKLVMQQHLLHVGNNFISYYAQAVDDNLAILYQDITPKEANWVGGFKEIPLMLGVYSREGNFTTHTLATNKELEIDPVPRFAGRVDDRSFVVFGQGKNAWRYRFLKVKL